MWQYQIFTIVIEAFVKVCVFFITIYNFEVKKCCPPNRLNNNFIKDPLLKKDFIKKKYTKYKVNKCFKIRVQMIVQMNERTINNTLQ